MKIKRQFLLFLVFMMFFSTVTYGDSLSNSDSSEIIEYQSEIKYGPFANENAVFKNDLDLQYTQAADTAYNYVELKNKIYIHIKEYEENFSINYKGDTSNLKNDINQIWEEIFEEDHYAYGTISRYGFEYSGYQNDVTINFQHTYHTNRRQEDFVDRKVDEIIGEIIKPNMSEFQKVKAVNDWIVNNTKYSYTANTSVHAAYTLFNEGKGVCQAYAMAAYRLLDELGIGVRYVTGNAGGPHGWNLVKIDGNWYHLDTTWNDPMMNDGSDMLSYEYFLISDATILGERTMDSERTHPSANDTRYEVMRGIQNPVDLGNCLYYRNGSDNGKLYKLDLDILRETKLIDNRVGEIAGHGEWLYYSNYSRDGYLYKIKTDGTDDTELNNQHSKKLYIEYPYLHYIVNGEEQSMLLPEYTPPKDIEPEEDTEIDMELLPVNSVIVGNEAFDIEYLNNNKNAQEKLLERRNQGKGIYIKLGKDIIVNIKGELVDIDLLPDELNYYDAKDKVMIYKKI